MVFDILLGVLAVLGIAFGIWANYSKKGAEYAEKFDQVRTEIERLIEVAEKFTNMTGEQKSQYVIDKVKIFEEKIGIDIPDYIVQEIIDRLIDLTNKVNVK